MLRERQVDILEKLIRGESFEWSVLVVDDVGQDIVAPLFRINELMEMGVVFCTRVDDDRDKIEEARAIYIVEETKENANIIKEDLLEQKYKEVEVIFTGMLSRELFEDLAVAVGRGGECKRVKKVMDGMIRLSVLHSSLYTLNIKDSFMKKGITSTLVSGLVSLLRGMDAPVLHIDKKYLELAEEVAKQVQKIGDRGRKGRKREAVLIVGREIDLITPIEHGWTYNALISDVLEYDLNKVTIPEGMARMEQVIGVDSTPEKKVFDLNRFDRFWDKNQNEYFQEVAERVEQELADYKADLAQRSIDSSSSKEVISSALSKVPELAQKNKVIHTHMTICLTLVEEIKKAKLDEVFGLENDTSRVSDIKDELEDLLGKIGAEHVLRMCAVLIKRFPNERAYLEEVAKKKGCSLELLRFFTQGEEEHSNSGSIVTGAAISLLRNIKRLLPRKKKLPIEIAVEDVVNGRSTYPTVGIESKQQPLQGGYSAVHVFSIGGGTFTEYKALMELGEQLGVEITYGTTEILSPGKFISAVTSVLKK
ncbi:hypothetical protein NEDG_01400 [Nematocida displodere]|uniref:Syntaxin-binding protein 1 n=1 Tax=Nematocida displodere TaxID=1805483 RepID=A0A177EBK7_9MICR|nr:hypothetical protein NEDG_01400 [Nematocida displodere]